MSKDGSFESLAADAGVDIAAAKDELAKLDAVFQGEKGDIPAGTLGAWANAHFPQEKLRAMALAQGRMWESGLSKKSKK